MLGFREVKLLRSGTFVQMCYAAFKHALFISAGMVNLQYYFQLNCFEQIASILGC